MQTTEGRRKALYICYFGLDEPLVQTQVIPYLKEIQRGGTSVSLLTFEPGETPPPSSAVRKALAANGIELHTLPYHKRPSALATAYDVLRGTTLVKRLIDQESIDILHCRIHVAALIGALARKRAKKRPGLIFDIRGFFPEEYTDAGVWKADGALYRTTKKVENWLMKESDGFVVLTQKAREILFPGSAGDADLKKVQSMGFADTHGRPLEVIPCCVDLDARFSGDRSSEAAEITRKLSLDGRKVYIHVGALGGLYLTDKLVDLLAAARQADPTTFAIFLTQSDPKPVRELLRQKGFGDNDVFLGRVASSEVPAYLAAADFGLSLVKSSYATQSRSPTKIPEYLAAGLPIIANAGVGDVDELIETERVGVLIRDLNANAFDDAIREAASLGNISTRCRAVARERFDLQTVGGVKYRRLYEKLSV